MLNTTTVLSRRNLIALALADVVLFALANITAESSRSPGTVSNVAWVLFLVGLVALIGTSVLALTRSRRSRAH
jgi:hypothetical protein